MQFEVILILRTAQLHDQLYIKYGVFTIAVPSQAPNSFSVTGVSSTIIKASWQLPPADSRHGIIRGFKLFYKKRCSTGSTTTLPINIGSILSTDVTGLENNTEYEFQVLAFTSAGDGPMSSPVLVKTLRHGKNS